MSVKAVFPAGATTATTDKLHQWDYGQILEIEAYDLPLVQEVHFACPEMQEAIVRPCSNTNGVTTVRIPDACLEESSTITAWVFAIDGTEGMTKKTVTIPVEPRTRPSPSGDVPVDVWNQYTELITEINEAVVGLANGDITAARAQTAGSAATAGSAGTAGHANTADSANYASSAGSAAQASYADSATNVSATINGKNISDIFESNGTTAKSATLARMIKSDNYITSISGAGLYVVIVECSIEGVVQSYETSLLVVPRFANGLRYYSTTFGLTNDAGVVQCYISDGVANLSIVSPALNKDYEIYDIRQLG